MGRDPKKNRKIFGKSFDKAQGCAILNITRLISANDLGFSGVIIEIALRRDGVVEERGSVLLKGVRETPEIFEKSIDKEKIDAILNSTVRFGRLLIWGWSEGGLRGIRREAGMSNHPDTRKKAGVGFAYV